MTLYEQAVVLAGRLSLAEKARLIAHLGTALDHDLEVEAFRRLPWHEFIERTAGSLADDPIERPPQLEFEVRDELE
jgi:hypothetical protein